jgi:hypothetical protein
VRRIFIEGASLADLFRRGTGLRRDRLVEDE